MNKKKVTMAAALAVVLTMIGAMALTGCPGNSPGDPSAPDTAALDAAIDAAETAKSGVAVDTDAANVAAGTRWVTQAELSALETAVTAAQAVAGNADATQAQVDGAVTALTTATTAFNAAKKEGSKTGGPSAADKTALAGAIDAANTAKAGVAVATDAANVATGTKWVTQADMTAFEAAITAAQAVAGNADATQAQVDDAVTALTTATTAFNAAKQDGSKPDTAALTAAISAATAAKTGIVVNTDAANVAIGIKWVSQAAMTVFETAISAAQAQANNSAATQADVNAAVETLTTATATFESAKREGTSAAAANAFMSEHGAILSETTATITIADKPAVQAAITAYNELSDAAKAALLEDSDTLAKLEALLTKINSLGTAENITLDFTDDGALLEPVTDLTMSAGQTLTLTAATGLAEIQWSLGGVDIPAPRGTAQSIVIAAANYPAGQYLLGLAATKGAVVCSTEITFTVTE